MSFRFRFFFLLLFSFPLTGFVQVQFVFSADFPQELKKIVNTIPSDIQQKAWSHYANKVQLEAYGLGYFLFESRWITHADSSKVIAFNAGKKFEEIELLSSTTIRKLKPKEFVVKNKNKNKNKSNYCPWVQV